MDTIENRLVTKAIETFSMAIEPDYKISGRRI